MEDMKDMLNNDEVEVVIDDEQPEIEVEENEFEDNAEEEVQEEPEVEETIPEEKTVPYPHYRKSVKRYAHLKKNSQNIRKSLIG